MRLIRSALVLTLALAALPAAAVQYAGVQADKSQLTYISKQMGVAVDGFFKRFTAQVSFDPAKPEAAQAQLDIDLASVDGGSSEVNDELKSRNWFNVKEHPTARFVASQVKSLGSNRFEVHGKLTIKGKTRDVVAPVTLKPGAGSATLEGAFAIRRLEFGIGSGIWGDTEVVADEVQLKFRLIVAEKK